jgi:hypothetical protein
LMVKWLLKWHVTLLAVVLYPFNRRSSGTVRQRFFLD